MKQKFLQAGCLLAAIYWTCAGLMSAQSRTAAGDERNFKSEWLELPAPSGIECTDVYYVTHRAEMQEKEQRNYSLCYDPDTYCSYWVAYPLCASHLSTGRSENWDYDDGIPETEQTSVASGYGASVQTPNYARNFYARGHQIPNADRNGVPEMLSQTYFSTNMTPQIQNGFNGGIWAQLEKAVREAVPENDTLYIITGAVFNRRGENIEVKTIANKNDGKKVPVPNYYWKAAMKVSRSPEGIPVDAEAIGFWLPHYDLKGHKFTEFAVPVDSIESWTGLDLYVNLPDNIENAAEVSASWTQFVSF